MFSQFSRGTPAGTADVPARLVLVTDLLQRLWAHYGQTGSFIGAMSAEIPKQMTEDGLQVACVPDLQVGVTAAGPAFGIECAGHSASDLAACADRALGLTRQGDWQADPQIRGAVRASVAMAQGQVLHLTCLPCPVDPCFNDQRQPGARLIGHLGRR